MEKIKEENMEDNMDESMEENEDMEVINEEGDTGVIEKKVYLPGQVLAKGETLVCDESAYIMLHQAHAGSPCLSFDILKDDLGENRENFPMTAYLVAGTQAEKANLNNIFVIKMHNMHKTQKDEDDESDSDSDDEDEEDENKKPLLDSAKIKHQGCVNRIRSSKVNNDVFVASWSELGRVNIWNISRQLTALENSTSLKNYNNDDASHIRPIFTFSGHSTEGYALDWCPTEPGVLASGDCKKDIHIWHPEETEWNVDQRPLIGHTDSIEDIQWSPNEKFVLASCSVDKSIRIWDIRVTPSKACMLDASDAHDSDINVLSWNRNEPFIVSGGDDGVVKIWDLRHFKSGVPVATFKHHTKPVTTVEWHPTESTIFASGGEDNQIALWDLSLEKDDQDEEEDLDVPPQLLFIHQGQTEIKELHWHRQLNSTIISTAQSGFNIFRTISV